MVRCGFMTKSTLHSLSTVYRPDSPCAWMLCSCFTATVLIMCYAGSEFVFHELHDPIPDFADELLAFESGHSDLTCFLSRLHVTAHKLSWLS